jgi:hypothetical protein
MTIVSLRGLLDSGIPFLEKPLSPQALASKMLDVIDGKAM